VLVDPAFRNGEAGIDYLDRREDLRDATLQDDARHRHGAAAAFALLHGRAAESLVPVLAAGWRNVGTAQHVDVLTDAVGTLAVRTGGVAHAAAVLVDGEWKEVGTARATETYVDLTVDGVRRRYRVRLAAHGAEVNGPEGQSSFARRTEDDPDEQGGTAGECRAPLPGAIARVLVTTGDLVNDGDPLVVLEAMKMEHTLRAAGTGTVGDVLCAPGDQVDVGDVLVVVEPA
jgi:propionyl-CoA carboxylase alpha chain